MHTTRAIERRCYRNTINPNEQLSTDSETISLIDNFIAATLRSSTFKQQSSSLKELVIYDGLAGTLYLYLYLYKTTNQTEYLKEAIVLAKTIQIDKQFLVTQQGSIDEQIGYLAGNAGVLSLCIIAFRLAKNSKRCVRLKNKLMELKDLCLKERNPDRSLISNELLAGRIGYVFACLQLNSYFDEEVISVSEVILPVAMKVVECGKRANLNRFSWKWLGYEYIGAVHGIAGILYILLQIPSVTSDSSVMQMIEDTCDWLVQIQLSSTGNWSSITECINEDELVQLCHGAPGILPLLLRMHELTGKMQYWLSCQKATDCIWRYGTLLKGACVCHGTSGNLYSFLLMSRATTSSTDQQRYKNMAKVFAIRTIQLTKSHQPNYTLFEGIAGVLIGLHAVKDFLNNKGQIHIPGLDLF